MPKKVKKTKPKKRFSLFPAYTDKILLITVILLILFSSVMIASAAMGEGAGDQTVIVRAISRQLIFFVIGIAAMCFCAKTNLINLRSGIYDAIYVVILIVLISTRLFGATYGAYAWIRIGPLSLQPSEFAKVFMILYVAKTMSKDYGQQTESRFLNIAFKALIYVGVILVWQKDLGSAVVLAGIVYVMLFIASYKNGLYKERKWMLIGILIIILLIVLIMLPITNEWLSEHFDGSYKIGRFLAAYNPFAYQYSTGYHLIMGLVSFATGGLFGLGYGQSIHKYMNFPNPTTDFILPVIVEELGVVFGLLPILLAYGIIFIKLMNYSYKMERIESKLILVGTFSYLFIHFILNVGGVSGIIPLTGVPLLLVSSGGSSLMATMIAIALCENEISKYRRSVVENANNSGQI